MSAPPDFDRLARIYRWLEYATFGLVLERTRDRYLGLLSSCSKALILGDGDGRFTARLLERHRFLHAHAVDSSANMLGQLRRNTAHVESATSRLRITHADIRTFVPAEKVDLIVTHFFLDCLTEPETESLIERMRPALLPGGFWLLSDFRIPPGVLHFPALVYVRSLYLAFRILTGLRTTHLPDYAKPLRIAGLTPVGVHLRLFGLLTAEVWQAP